MLVVGKIIINSLEFFAEKLGLCDKWLRVTKGQMSGSHPQWVTVCRSGKEHEKK